MPGLMAVIGGNAVPLKRTLDDVENAARRAGMALPKAMGHGMNAGAMREFLVLIREVSRGNWTRVPGSLSILLSRLGALKLLLNPITIGLVAVGAAAFVAVRRFLNLEESSRNLKEVMDQTRTKFSLQAEEMKRAAERAQAFNDWIKALGKSQEDLSQKTEDAITAMKEQARYERELAAEKGATKRDLAKMDIDTAKKELEMVTRAKEAIDRRVAQDKAAARTAEKLAGDANRPATIKDLGERGQLMGKVVDALQKKMREGANFMILDPDIAPGGEKLGGPHNRNDVLDVEVDGKKFHLSLKQATESFQALAKREQRLATIQKQLDDLVQRKKKLTEKDITEQERLTREQKRLQTDLDLKSKFLPQIAMDPRLVHGSVNDLQRHGAYAQAAGVALVDINRKMHGELKGIRSAVEKHGGGGAMGRVKY